MATAQHPTEQLITKTVINTMGYHNEYLIRLMRRYLQDTVGGTMSPQDPHRRRGLWGGCAPPKEVKTMLSKHVNQDVISVLGGEESTIDPTRLLVNTLLLEKIKDRETSDKWKYFSHVTAILSVVLPVITAVIQYVVTPHQTMSNTFSSDDNKIRLFSY